MTLALLAGVFTLLLLLRVPIAVAIGLASLSAMLLSLPLDAASMTMAQKIAASGFSFTLIAIPLFILAGKLMAVGGVARRLIAFAQVAIGWLPGGLALTNVLSCMLFGSVSGSAAAAASGIGGFMIPAMNAERYPKGFSAALTATAATTGLLIPPSNVMIVYASVAGGVSISALFVAGYVPGILLGLVLMTIAAFISARAGYGVRHARPGLVAFARASVGVLPSLALLVLIMGGIVSGLFTATEASAVAVVYAAVLALGVYREVDFSQLVAILRDTAAITGMVFLLIGCSLCLAFIFAYADVPQLIIASFAGFADSPWLVLLLINVLLLAIGTFMDITPALLIFTPIFLPLMLSLAPVFGLSAEEMKYHFGILIVFNLCLGLVTPPAGTTLFIAAGVARTSLAEIARPLLPIFLASVAVLLLVSYVPDISLWLPRVLGLLE
jgi:tripartite ATP-independent transporter DctM subunit